MIYVYQNLKTSNIEYYFNTGLEPLKLAPHFKKLGEYTTANFLANEPFYQKKYQTLKGGDN